VNKTETGRLHSRGCTYVDRTYLLRSEKRLQANRIG